MAFYFGYRDHGCIIVLSNYHIIAKMTTTLPHTFTLTVGDYSRDGHEKSEVLLFSCSHSKNQLQAFYTSASVNYKLDLKKQCSEYKNDSFTVLFYKKLLEVFKDDPIVNTLIGAEVPLDEDDPDAFIAPDTYAELYLHIAKLACSDLVWESKSDTTDNINIGGYGLFY